MYQDFFNTFFIETNLKEVLRMFYDNKINTLHNIRQDYFYYDAKYDYYFILKNLSDTEIDDLIRKKKKDFIKENDFFDKEVFLLDSGLNLFIDNLNDHIGAFKRGKCYEIEGSNKYFIHHFELIYNFNSGKTIVFSTKKLPQVIYYLKKILNKIELIINETEMQIEQNNGTYLKNKIFIKDKLNSIHRDGWKYVFYEEEDFNAFIIILSDYFSNNLIPNKIIIETNKKSKTRVAKVLNDIYKRCCQIEILRGNTDFFNVIRVLSCLNEIDDDELYKMMQR